MRIISGKFKGRRLTAPRNLPVRPTTNFAKESIFNVLHHRVAWEELKVLDLFCGTGNISLEFISRGVHSVLSVDSHSGCIKFIRDCCKLLEVENLHLLKRDALQFIQTTSANFDLIYADPPYDLKELAALPDMVLTKNILTPSGWFILEHGPKQDFSAHPHFYLHRNYGHVNFTIFSNAAED
jgi:16S rRNA (guanine966-N2)-methyltransferase